MSNYYITFGSNSPLRNKFVVVEADTELNARAQVFKRYGAKWAFIYDEKRFAGQPEKYNLQEVSFGTTSV